MIHRLLQGPILVAVAAGLLIAACLAANAPGDVGNDVKIPPSRIALHRKNAPAKAMYAETFRQAHAELQTNPTDLLDNPALPPLSVDASGQAFWNVMLQLEKTTGLLPEVSGLGQIQLQKVYEDLSGKQEICGPFLIVAAKLNGFSDRHARRGERLFQSEIHFYPEPKLHLLPGQPEVTIKSAIDDAGNSLVPEQGGISFVGAPRGGPLTLLANFNYAPFAKDKAKTLSSLHLLTRWKIAEHWSHVDIPNVLHAGAQAVTIGNVAVTINVGHQRGYDYRVSLSAAKADADALKQLILRPETRVHLLGINGDAFPCQGQDVETNDAGTSIDLDYARGGQPYRLIIDVPLDVRTIEIPVDFTDLKMPLPN